MVRARRILISNLALYRGRIYVGAGDGLVYCLGKKEGQ